MFDEDLFNVFNETHASTEKSGSQKDSGSLRDAGTKTKHRQDKGNSEKEKTDNKRYEHTGQSFRMTDPINIHQNRRRLGA